MTVEGKGWELTASIRRAQRQGVHTAVGIPRRISAVGLQYAGPGASLPLPLPLYASPRARPGSWPGPPCVISLPLILFAQIIF